VTKEKEVLPPTRYVTSSSSRLPPRQKHQAFLLPPPLPLVPRKHTLGANSKKKKSKARVRPVARRTSTAVKFLYQQSCDSLMQETFFFWGVTPINMP